MTKKWTNAILNAGYDIELYVCFFVVVLDCINLQAAIDEIQEKLMKENQNEKQGLKPMGFKTLASINFFSAKRVSYKQNIINKAIENNGAHPSNICCYQSLTDKIPKQKIV